MTDEAKTNNMPERIFATPAPSERDKYASRWPSDTKRKAPGWGFWSNEADTNEDPVEYIRSDVVGAMLSFIQIGNPEEDPWND